MMHTNYCYITTVTLIKKNKIILVHELPGNEGTDHEDAKYKLGNDILVKELGLYVRFEEPIFVKARPKLPYFCDIALRLTKQEEKPHLILEIDDDGKGTPSTETCIKKDLIRDYLIYKEHKIKTVRLQPFLVLYGTLDDIRKEIKYQRLNFVKRRIEDKKRLGFNELRDSHFKPKNFSWRSSHSQIVNDCDNKRTICLKCKKPGRIVEHIDITKNYIIGDGKIIAIPIKIGVNHARYVLESQRHEARNYTCYYDEDVSKDFIIKAKLRRDDNASRRAFNRISDSMNDNEYAGISILRND